jgi:hypothetical protein
VTKTLPIEEILRGIRAGRSLKQIEEALGVSAVDFLEATAADEGLNIRFKAAQAISAYSLGAELMQLARENYEAPQSAVKNNALKLYMDVLQKEMDARNPAVFSGKAPINVSVPIQITTTLDMGGQKTIEGVYDLTASVVHDLETEKLPISAGEATGSEPGRVVGAGAEDIGVLEAPNPFQAALAEAAEPPKTGPRQAGRDKRVGKRAPRRAKGQQQAAAGEVSGEQSRASGAGANKEPAGDAAEASE